jgi:hypothetical protein
MFKTKDGLTLKGWLYPVGEKGPCVIMSHGVGAVISQFDSSVG